MRATNDARPPLMIVYGAYGHAATRHSAAFPTSTHPVITSASVEANAAAPAAATSPVATKVVMRALVTTPGQASSAPRTWPQLVGERAECAAVQIARIPGACFRTGCRRFNAWYGARCHLVIARRMAGSRFTGHAGGEVRNGCGYTQRGPTNSEADRVRAPATMITAAIVAAGNAESTCSTMQLFATAVTKLTATASARPLSRRRQRSAPTVCSWTVLLAHRLRKTFGAL